MQKKLGYNHKTFVMLALQSELERAGINLNVHITEKLDNRSLDSTLTK